MILKAMEVMVNNLFKLQIIVKIVLDKEKKIMRLYKFTKSYKLSNKKAKILKINLNNIIKNKDK